MREITSQGWASQNEYLCKEYCLHTLFCARARTFALMEFIQYFCVSKLAFIAAHVRSVPNGLRFICQAILAISVWKTTGL